MSFGVVPTSHRKSGGSAPRGMRQQVRKVVPDPELACQGHIRHFSMALSSRLSAGHVLKLGLLKLGLLADHFGSSRETGDSRKDGASSSGEQVPRGHGLKGVGERRFIWGGMAH